MLRKPMNESAHTDGGLETTDPRILRSRRMLMDSLRVLLLTREFDDISIQEIADHATLNRATFYLHYPDKSALMRAMTAERFGELVLRRGLSFTDCEGALRAIALGVCDYLAESTSCPGQLVTMSLEGSIIPVVEAMLRKGTVAHGGRARDAEFLAATAAWAIFGAARSWFQTPDRIPADEMAGKIEKLVKPIFLSGAR